MAKDDDFDEWLDDDEDGELDQFNIDALLNNVDDNSDTKGASSSSELDQSNIDALLDIPGDDNPPQAAAASENTDMAELDQENIDALLGGADDKIDELDQDNIDALLGGSDDSIDELDQDNIDALLGGSDDNIDELDQDNIDALLGGSDDNIDELDQDNIDALLGGSDDNIDELDQDNIDALLGGTDTPSPAKAEPDDDLGELDQNNIDDLLAGNDTPEEPDTKVGQDDLDELFTEELSLPEADTGDAEAEQDDIDALFNDINAAASDSEGDGSIGGDANDQSLDELFTEDDTNDKTTLGAESIDDAGETAFGSDFDEMDQLFAELEEENSDEEDPFQSEEIDFAEMLDGSNSVEDDNFLELGDDDDEFAMPPAADEDATDIDALLTADDEGAEDDPSKKGIAIPAFITGMSKATLSAIGGGVTLLLIAGLYFIFSGNDSEDIIVANPEVTAEQENTVPPTQENFIPLGKDSTYAMDNTGSGMAIELQGIDEDGQPLIYQITREPIHGRISGTAPNLTYLANNNFPGEDSFEYTVNDGVDTSASALIKITGPDLKAQALNQKLVKDKDQSDKKVFKPKKPVVLAKNVHFSTESTVPITIDWQRIWKKSNKSAYNPKIHVEIVKAEAGGTLNHISSNKTVFTPDPFSGRTDLIYYRFKKDGFRSPMKTISIHIALGNPAPEIHFTELKKGHIVGQNVHLDVSPSRDDSPGSLKFAWKQISGVPVSMKISQDNGSKIDFVMPSSFYNEKNPGPTFEVTATDKTGQTTSREVMLRTISRRQAALWRGSNGDIAEEPVMQGQFFPWPYED